MAPAIDALSQSHRVLSFSLGDPIVPPQPEGTEPFQGWLAAIDAILDRAAETQAAIVGVSFGGLIAARYAAKRPDRATALVLVSAPRPTWRPNTWDRLFIRYPRLARPAFLARGCLRLIPEIFVANSTWVARLKFGADYASRAIRSPLSPPQMARWVRQWMTTDVREDCRAIRVPTLLITGEPHLDRVVPVSSTLAYLELICGARHRVLSGTGHVGLVSKPREFARLVGEFISPAYAS
jgi:pimeloyl-ACP methyl ester carboxylesterase